MHKKGYTPDIHSGYLWVEELFRDFFSFFFVSLFSLFSWFSTCHFPNQGDAKDGGSEEEALRRSWRCLEHPELPPCSPPPLSLPSQGFCPSLPRWRGSVLSGRGLIGAHRHQPACRGRDPVLS